MTELQLRDQLMTELQLRDQRMVCLIGINLPTRPKLLIRAELLSGCLKIVCGFACWGGLEGG